MISILKLDLPYQQQQQQQQPKIKIYGTHTPQHEFSCVNGLEITIPHPMMNTSRNFHIEHL